MRQPAPTLTGTLNLVRVIHVFMFVSMFTVIDAVERLLPHRHGDVGALWVPYLVLATANVGLILFFRLRQLRSATQSLKSNPSDVFALNRMRFVNILTFVILESVVLFGFSMRFMGGTLVQSLPFYVAGIALMVIWWPRRP